MKGRDILLVAIMVILVGVMIGLAYCLGQAAHDSSPTLDSVSQAQVNRAVTATLQAAGHE